MIAQNKYKSESTRYQIQVGENSAKSLKSQPNLTGSELQKKLMSMDSGKSLNRVHSALSGDFDIGQLKSQRDQLTSELEMLDYSKIIVPVNIGVKYRPPKIGIEFYLKNDENFNKSLTRKGSYESVLINDLDNFSEKLLVHEVYLDLELFTKEAIIHGERSYDWNRENSHLSPMKEKLSAKQIAQSLFSDSRHRAFLNNKVIK